MAIKLPRYVRSQSNRLVYSRDYPTKLQRAAGKKTFTYQLGLKLTEHTEATLSRATAVAADNYQLALKRISNNDPSSYSLNELDAAAMALLKARRLQPAQFATDNRKDHIIEHEKRNKQHSSEDNHSLAEFALPEFEDMLFKQRTGQALTFEDKVYGHAWLKLVNIAKSKPQTLSLLWEEYAQEKGIDSSSREGKRITTHWLRWLATTGEVATSSPNALDHIHAGLDRFVAEEMARGIKGQSVKRGLVQVLACLREANLKYRLGWVIQSPRIPTTAAAKKDILSQQEQRDLLDYCINRPNQNRLHKRIAAAVLLMLQGGCMTSEISRLDLDKDIAVTSSVPHILIRNKTKTTDRKRVVPVVVGADYIGEHLKHSVMWLSTVQDSSKVVKSFITRATGNSHVSGHGLRHTFKANALINSANMVAVAAIAGWASSAGMSSIMLGYGAEGLSSSESLQELRRQSLIIHKHLLT